MKVPLTLQKLLSDIPTVDFKGVPVIPEFGVFIDTHRDQPHIGSFGDDIHRGSCRPQVVHLHVEDAAANPAKLWLTDPDQPTSYLALHEKHMFVTQEFWGDFLVKWMMDHNGALPLDNEGIMVTSHLRDARQKVYKLKSFRQMLEWRHEAMKNGQAFG